MHILLIHQAFAALDEPGGTRHYELARYLAKRGHRVTIIASPISYLTGQARGEQTADLNQDIDHPNINVLRAYAYTALHRSFVHRVFSFLSFMLSSFWLGIKVKNVDLVWGTSPPIFQGATAWALARIKRVPFLFEVRDLWPAFAIAIGVLQNPLLIRLSEWLEKFLYQHADQVMVNSPGFIEYVEQRGAGKVALVPNGADTIMFDPDSTGADFRKLHALEHKFLALYAGAHGMSNDLGVILQAAAYLDDREDISIVLLGAGKDKPALVSKAKTMGLKNVTFIPPMPKNQMPSALAAADACIAILKPLDLYKTVYPNKVFDYLAAGRPVVLAIDGVIRQVVEDAGAGLFVMPGDPAALAAALRRLADDPQSARNMGIAGRQYLEQHFDRSTLADHLCLLLEKMIMSEDR